MTTQPAASHDWAFADMASDEVVDVIGTIPGRWGRMTPLSRLLVVEVGRLLRGEELLPESGNCFAGGVQAGFIGGCRRGSLQTDLDFIETMSQGIGLASPALFGYTLPNTPLAEAAGHYGLVGPVYALLDDNDPFGAAVREAEITLAAMSELDFLVAGEFDHFPAEEPAGKPHLVANLTVIRRKI